MVTDCFFISDVFCFVLLSPELSIIDQSNAEHAIPIAALRTLHPNLTTRTTSMSTITILSRRLEEIKNAVAPSFRLEIKNVRVGMIYGIRRMIRPCTALRTVVPTILAI